MDLGANIIGGILMAGEKPKVPEVKDISVGDEQQRAIAANLAAIPDLTKLASQYNAFNLAETLKARKSAIPGFENLLTKGSQVLQEQIAGKIPQDVQQLIKQQTAQSAIGGGFAGSNMARNLEARDLGLTSLQITNQALGSSAQWLQNAAALTEAPRMDISQMFITPGMAIQTALANRDFSFSRNWLAAQVAAAPDPMSAAIGGAIIKTSDQLTSLASSAIGAVAGGLGGGGGSKPLSTSGGTSSFGNYSPAFSVPQNFGSRVQGFA